MCLLTGGSVINNINFDNIDFLSEDDEYSDPHIGNLLPGDYRQ